MAGTRSGTTTSTQALYASTIAIVSGAYSILTATGGSMMADGGMAAGTVVMLLVGLVALVHGIVLLTPAAERLGSWNGPAMVAYAVIMLLSRAVLPMGMDSGRMGPMMDSSFGFDGMMGGYLGTMGPGGGPGMVALALLMLASGLIMTLRDDRVM